PLHDSSMIPGVNRVPQYLWPGQRLKPRTLQITRLRQQLAQILKTGQVVARPNGAVNVQDVLGHPELRGYDFRTLEKVLRLEHTKYQLVYDPSHAMTSAWWILPIPNPDLNNPYLALKRLTSPKLTKLAVHGTSLTAWQSILRDGGLSRMARDHIHLGQSLHGTFVPGLASAYEILIYVDVFRAMKADITFYAAPDSTLLTPGDELGYLQSRFFSRVEHISTEIENIPTSRYDDPIAWRNTDR
ncbi:unnamed protein product, partial [Mycena citricolor]